MFRPPGGGPQVLGPRRAGTTEPGLGEAPVEAPAGQAPAGQEPPMQEPGPPGPDSAGPSSQGGAVRPVGGGAVSGGAVGPAGAVHPRLWQRRVAVLRDQGRRRLRWVVAGVALLVVLCVAMLVLHTPLVAVQTTTVRGAGHTGVGAVLEAAGLTGHPPLIDVDPATTAARIEALPWVAHATVVRRWPDAVAIVVTERVPLGVVARPGGGVAVVDGAGRVLAWEDRAPAGLVLGVPTAPGPPGTVLPAADHPALEVAGALPAPVAGRVRQVTVDGSGQVTLDLGGGVSAVLGPTEELRAKLAALASVLVEARPRGPAVIDLTIPDQPTVGPPPPAPAPASKAAQRGGDQGLATQSGVRPA